jgi:hypothetical protein
MKQPKLMYLAHPVRGYRFWTAFAFLRALNEVARPRGWAVVCPWLPQVIAASSDGDEELRNFWLSVDVRHVQMYDAFVAVGEEVTAGMQLEMDAAAGKPARDMTTLTPVEAAAYVTVWLDNMETP